MDVTDSRPLRRRRTESDIQPTPITDGDLPPVSEFLHANHDDRVPWDRACAPSGTGAPNHGFMLKDGPRVVGVLLAIHSERYIAGRTERFCNIGTWCVLPEYRSRSLSLLKAVLAQQDHHFTVLSPNPGPREILTFMKFRFLDTTAAMIPNLPWPTLPTATRVITRPQDIESVLSGTDLEIYRDHAHALATRHLVLCRGDAVSHVMYREFRHDRGPGYAMILYVSNREVFHRGLRRLTRHLLVRRGLVATLAELRIVGDRTQLPLPSFTLRDRPKMYRSPGLGPDQIDYLYSELTCVPW